MPAIPAVGLGISAFSAIKNARASGRAGNAQNALLGEQTSAARQSRQYGTSMVSQGMPAQVGALSYYGKLLSGNRAAMAQATAGGNRQITDTYRGAERGLEHQGIRGGERATALAELNRDKAASLAGLTTGVQGNAADRSAEIGGELSRTGMAGISGAGTQFGSGAEQYGKQAAGFQKAQGEDMKGMGYSLGMLLDWWKHRHDAN